MAGGGSHPGHRVLRDWLHAGTPRIPALPLPGNRHDICMRGLSPWAMVVQHARQVLEMLWNPNLWTPWGLHVLPSLKSELGCPQCSKPEERASSAGSWAEASWLWFPMNLNDMKYILLTKIGTVLSNQQAQTRTLPWADTGLRINSARCLFAVHTTCIRSNCPLPTQNFRPQKPVSPSGLGTSHSESLCLLSVRGPNHYVFPLLEVIFCPYLFLAWKQVASWAWNMGLGCRTQRVWVIPRFSSVQELGMQLSQ